MNDMLNKNPEFLIEILDHLPDAIVLVDKQKKIRYYNAWFIKIFGDDDHMGKVFGESISCKGDKEKKAGVDFPIICRGCKFLKSINKAFNEKLNQDKESIVIESHSGDDEKLLLIDYQVVYLNHKETEYVLIKMNDNTQLGKKVADFLQ